MSEKITVLIADDSAQTRQSLKAMLEIEKGLEVVGEAGDGRETVEAAEALKPDVILMDVNMPEMDGITATTTILARISTAVVMISVQGEQEYLRRAMQAGARDFLVKPFTLDELVDAIHRAHRSANLDAIYSRPPASGQRAGRVITVFSTKGGVGKTTLAVNLAVSLGVKTHKRVALVDLDLEFGTVTSMLGLKPSQTIADLCRVDSPLNLDLVDRVMVAASSSLVRVLAAPPSPEQAAEVDAEGRKQRDRNYVGEIVGLLKQGFDYVVIDTASNFRDATLTALDLANQVLLIATPEIPTLHNTAKSLDILLNRLAYTQEKIKLVLNRADGAMGLTQDDITRSLDYRITFTLPSDGPTAIWSANSGQPFVLRKSRSGLADAVQAIADALLDHNRLQAQSDAEEAAAPGEPARRRRGIFSLSH